MANNDVELWAYDEPHESGGNCQITMTKAQAIAWMHKTHPCRYGLDERAFDDWVVVNWAYRAGLVHSPRCGVDFRGCAPDCPKDRAEREEGRT